MSVHEENKRLINELRAALYDLKAHELEQTLRDVFTPDADIHLAFPLEDLSGPEALFEQAYRPLIQAMPDLERRDFIVMAGETNGHNWVGCGGHYLGVFEEPWLDIPPTHHVVAMRFHEFFRIQDAQIVEVQALWDIPQVMMQAQAWPMSPSLGVDWLVPGPATQDGIITTPYAAAKAQTNVDHVLAMLTDMGKHPLQGDVEIMSLARYWHPKFLWYGPSGIGSTRRVSGFRNWHQIPFLKAMPDRRGAVTDAAAMFGDGDYVGTTGWPNMQMTLSGDGWLGIAPSDKALTMRSLDFWRIENGLIRENWVLVDLLHVYDQLGVDVFSRMREFTYARQPR